MEPVINQKEKFMVIEGGKKTYTTADIEALPPGERAELIDGEMFIMEAPSITHQRILGELHVQIYMHIKNKKGSCEVFISPAVYVKDDIHNYVEPDITVICKEDKLDEKGCHGAPDWAVEIVSPSSRKMDYVRKTALYKEAGVREYWIVDPEEKLVIVNDFGHRKKEERYSFEDQIRVGIFEDLYICVSNLEVDGFR